MLQINFDIVAEMLKKSQESRHIQVVDEKKICRSNGLIITKSENKDYKIVFDKRVIKDVNATYPYGM